MRIRALMTLATVSVMTASALAGDELEVLSVFPPQAALDADASASLTITFDRPIDPKSVTPNAFHAFSRGAGALVGAFRFSSDGRSVTLDPNIVLVDMCGTKVQAVEGQSLGAMAQRARAPITFGCAKGECGSCESIVNGKKRRICTMAVPKKGPLVVKAQVKLGRNGKPVVKDW